MNLDLVTSRLSANADVFMGLLQGLGPEQAAWKPRPESWSIVEVINHLADEEVEDFRTRVELTLTSPGTPWPPIDPEEWARSRSYLSRDLGESLGRFLDERTRSVLWLNSLHAQDWTQSTSLPDWPSIRAGDLVAAWLEHDLIHIRQIVRLHHEFLTRALAPYEIGYAGDW